MASLNSVSIIGRLGKDPEIRKTPSGAAVCSFSIATSEKYNDKQGQQQEATEWHNIVAWNKTAETMGQYLRKGSLVYLEGKLKTSSWEDNGVKKYKTDIIVGQFQFLDSKPQDNQQQQGGGFQQQAPQQQVPQQQGFGQPHQQDMGFQAPQQQGFDQGYGQQ